MTDELPNGWSWATVDELVVRKADVTDGPFGSNLKTEHYTESGPRVVRLQNIADGVFLDDRAHVSDERFETLRKHEVIAGDVLVASLGEHLPRACVAPSALGPAIVKADCIRVRVSSELDPTYVMWALNAPATRAKVSAEIKGVGRPRVNLGTLRALALPVAPLAEQRRIVDELERRLSHVHAAERSIRAALLRLHVAREAVLWSTVLPGSEAPHDDMTPELPEGWEWTTLADAADVVGGVTKDSKRQGDPSFVEMPYLRVANVQRGFLDLAEVSTIRVSPAKAKALRLEHGDVLFNEGGDRDKLGRGWIWEGQVPDCIHQNHVFRARLTDERLDPRFVSWAGNSYGRRWFEAAGKQTTNLASINLRTLKSFPIPVPPADELPGIIAEAERRLSLIDAAERTAEANVARIAQLRRALIDAAFSGRLVRQDPDDEPADALLARIRDDRAAATPKKKTRPRRNKETVA